MSGLVRELLAYADRWKFPLVVSGQDVKTAFDSVPHWLIGEALGMKGLSNLDVALQMRELTGLKARITLPCVGCTDFFDFEKGGKQGGVESPDQWRAVVDFILEPVVCSWQRRGYGFRIGNADDPISKLVNHAVWADNVVFFAASIAMMQTMVSEVDAAFGKFKDNFGRRYFEWKTDSLSTWLGDH